MSTPTCSPRRASFPMLALLLTFSRRARDHCHRRCPRRQSECLPGARELRVELGQAGLGRREAILEVRRVSRIGGDTVAGPSQGGDEILGSGVELLELARQCLGASPLIAEVGRELGRGCGRDGQRCSGGRPCRSEADRADHERQDHRDADDDRQPSHEDCCRHVRETSMCVTAGALRAARITQYRYAAASATRTPAATYARRNVGVSVPERTPCVQAARNTTIDRRCSRSQTPGGSSFVQRAETAVINNAYRPMVPSATATVLYSDIPGTKAPTMPTCDFGSPIRDRTCTTRKAVTKIHRWSCQGKIRLDSFQVALLFGWLRT